MSQKRKKYGFVQTRFEIRGVMQVNENAPDRKYDGEFERRLTHLPRRYGLQDLVVTVVGGQKNNLHGVIYTLMCREKAIYLLSLFLETFHRWLLFDVIDSRWRRVQDAKSKKTIGRNDYIGNIRDLRISINISCVFLTDSNTPAAALKRYLGI